MSTNKMLGFCLIMLASVAVAFFLNWCFYGTIQHGEGLATTTGSCILLGLCISVPALK